MMITHYCRTQEDALRRAKQVAKQQAMITMELLCLMVEDDLRFTRMGIWWRGIWFINKTVPLYGGWIVYLYHDL